MACLVVLVIICGLVWVVEFAQLMAMRDEDFPGRYDKALWVAGFVFGNIFGVFAFFLWKRDRVFENREAMLLHTARSAAREAAHAPAAPVSPVSPPRPPAPSSTAIQRPADGGP
jgi:hypothetical protein